MTAAGPSTPVMLRHGRVDLALWCLREAADAAARPLLLLHGLGERTPVAVPPGVDAWPGAIHGLDFTGHGASTVPAGGGYYCEVLMGDVDTALVELGPATIVGRGLGGYVALLIAGARPALVRGAVIADGPGLHGGGTQPGTTSVLAPAAAAAHRDGSVLSPDPFALVELARDVRPPDYARSFAWQASALSGLDTAIAVTAVNRPPWLAEVATQPGVVETDLAGALRLFA